MLAVLAAIILGVIEGTVTVTLERFSLDSALFLVGLSAEEALGFI